MAEDCQIHILNNMDMVVMERRSDEGFGVLGSSPAWFRLFFMKEESPDRELPPDKMNPFLENFLTDAENFWRSGTGGKLRSDPWLENDPVSGEEYAFEAIAVSAAEKKVLLIEKVSCSYYKEKQAIIQKGRELNLAYYRLAKIEAELRRTKEAAEAANRAKSEFLSNMGHELRTPMNAVIGFIYLVLQTTLTSSQTEYLNHAYTSAQLLMKLLNDILMYSELEAERYHIEETEFTIDDVMKALSDKMRFKAEEKGLFIRFSIAEGLPCKLTGDFAKLDQILTNLIENAIKFTETGIVSVKTDMISRSEHKVRLGFSVTDTGIGIPSDKLAIIFNAFTQGDGSITRKFGGAGLGLTICKRLAEIMGGEIGVESEAGRGSTFTLTIEFGIASGGNFEAFRNYIRNMETESLARKFMLSEPDSLSDISIVTMFLKELKSLLQVGDFESTDYMRQIRNDLSRSVSKDKIARLEALIYNYDFEKAEMILDDILNTIKEN